MLAIPNKNAVLGSVLCRHDRAVLAKSANIWLLGRHVANMLATFSAKKVNQAFEADDTDKADKANEAN
jgi:hypothetical protein